MPPRHATRPALVSTLALAAAVTTASAADTLALHSFVKQRLDEHFYAEGAAVADIDRDGHLDVIAGPFWYAGPDFTQRHAFIPDLKPLDPHSYSQLQFFTFAADIDGDGWPDIVTIGYPGKECFWWENPHATDKPWIRHLALAAVDNESPCLAPMDGDQRPCLVCTHQGRLGYAKPDVADPRAPWPFHAVSEKGPWTRYAHGLGWGDVNGDGRLDLLMKEGWWEHPATPGDAPWTLHRAAFGSGGAQMRVVDIDGDGRNDVVTSLSAHEYGLAWFQQQADGGFTRHLIMGDKPEQNPYGVCFSQLHALVVDDLDGDGLPDIITGKRHWAHGPDKDPEPNAAAVLYWFRQVRDHGEVSFVPILIDDDSGVGVDLLVADVDGDGLKDIVVSNKKGTFVFHHRVRQVPREEWLAAQPKPLR